MVDKCSYLLEGAGQSVRDGVSENARIEMAQPGKWLKNHTPENDRKIKFGKCQNVNFTPWKIPEWQMYNLENTRTEMACFGNDRKITTQNRAENIHP